MTHSCVQRFSLGVFAALSVCLGFAGCTRPIEHHGYFDKANGLSKITLNTSTQGDVLQTLGTPSFEGAFDSNIWYYLGQSFRVDILTAPDEIDRQIIAITFDDRDKVQTLATLTLGDGIAVVPASETTPVIDKDLSALEQIASNIGRIGSSAPPSP